MMTMTTDVLSQWLKGLSLVERAKALNLVSYQLTIYARAYGLPEWQRPDLAARDKLLGVNELQHQLLAQTGHYLHGEDSKVYPVEVFSKIIFEKAHNYGLTALLVSAIKHVQDKLA
jgi:hypothetical protein